MREYVIFTEGDLLHYLNRRDVKTERTLCYENKDIRDRNSELRLRKHQLFKWKHTFKTVWVSFICFGEKSISDPYTFKATCKKF